MEPLQHNIENNYKRFYYKELLIEKLPNVTFDEYLGINQTALRIKFKKDRKTFYPSAIIDNGKESACVQYIDFINGGAAYCSHKKRPGYKVYFKTDYQTKYDWDNAQETISIHEYKGIMSVNIDKYKK